LPRKDTGNHPCLVIERVVSRLRYVTGFTPRFAVWITPVSAGYYRVSDETGLAVYEVSCFGPIGDSACTCVCVSVSV